MSDSGLSEALKELATSTDRSDSARLRTHIDEVEEALASGVSRAKVLELLRSRGFTMTMKGFESALYRIRKQRRAEAEREAEANPQPAKDTPSSQGKEALSTPQDDSYEARAKQKHRELMKSRRR